MTLGENMAMLRKKEGSHRGTWAKAVSTSGNIIGRYECDEVKPSIEVAVKMADALKFSLDFLMGKTSTKMDKAVLKRIEELAKLSAEAKN